MGTALELALVRLNGEARPEHPLLLVGSSLGTSVTALWSRVADHLQDDFDVVGWDLPGHGLSGPAASSFALPDLGRAVLDVVARARTARGKRSETFFYAGDSLGGAVGLQLMLDAREQVAAAVVLCSGAKIGEPTGWQERAELVRRSGTRAVVETAAARWFGPGFSEREPTVASELLDSLLGCDDTSYALACEALARFDVRSRLAQITAPVLAVAGSDDVTTPVAALREVAEGVAHGTLVVLDGVAHVAPAEAPATVAALIRDQVASVLAPAYDASSESDGMRVRREVLGDVHVDRAMSAATPFGQEFQEFITRYAWGEVWTRPGLDRRTRSMITLTALVAGGHHEELALHVRAARTNGVTADEIKEVLIHTAVYVGVPAANSAFKIASQVLEELGDRGLQSDSEDVSTERNV
jgi:3-oxoadipate enol-lactonase / 4-carboxymuconolactone decarboxylase